MRTRIAMVESTSGCAPGIEEVTEPVDNIEEVEEVDVLRLC